MDTWIRLGVAPEHRSFLAECFAVAQDGRLDDLRDYRAQLADPERDERDARLYGRLREEVQHGELSGDPAELRAVLAEQLASVDDANAYASAVAEHDAFAHLLAQLDQARASRPAGSPPAAPGRGAAPDERRR
jgi:hypothetical protein